MVEFDYGPYGRPEEREAAATAAKPGVHHTGFMLDRLRDTRPWVLLLAIVAFIGGGLMLLATLAMVVGVAMTQQVRGGPELGAVVFGGVFYGFLGAFCFFYGVVLVRYASAIARAVASDSTVDVEGALDAQRFLWKSIGIATIASMVLAILATAGVMIFGVASAGAF